MNIRDFVEKTIVLRGLATLALVNSLLLGPVWILNRRVGPELFALEAGVVLGVFMLLPAGRRTRVLSWCAAVAIVVLAVLEFADTVARVSLARPLNLYLDVRLVSAVSNLLRGSLGVVQGVGLMVLAGFVAVAVTGLLAVLLANLGAPSGNRLRRAVGAGIVVACLLAVPGRWLHARGVVLGIPLVQLVREQVPLMARMLQERESFTVEMMAARSSYADEPGLLTGLGGRDVTLAFIESYGMSALSDDRYAPVVLPRLEGMAQAVEGAGLFVATGVLEAPSQGGMSWLGHGSVLSGLWLENQLRYDLLLSSDRRTLVDDFSAAGYRTVALMPAITLAWPEGERLGYDRIYAARDIDYQGPPLNWVTMPDQFTWSFLERSIRGEGDGRPLFAEVGLISSHAPWTPILDVLDDWDAVGAGEVFEPWADAGESPEALWLDTDRVREQYALSIGYALDVLASYAARYVGEGAVLVAMGDHQPAPLITGEDATRGVPVHVFVSDAGLLEPFLAWGFRPGTVPATSPRSHRMDEFRAWFVSAFSGPARGTTP